MDNCRRIPYFGDIGPYAVHAVIGGVIAATIVIIPFDSFINSISVALINFFCFMIGSVVALALDKFNQNITKEKVLQTDLV